MKSERWEQAKLLYEAALGCPTGERLRFLNENCAGDEELRREIASLLSFSDDAETFLEKPAVGAVARDLLNENQKLNGGRRLGHYEIIEQIGAGGMGEVYLARDAKLDRRVALKILPPEFSADTERMRRFVREAKSASALNHPNIITIYEIGEVEGTHFIATEFIDGATLSEYLKTERLNFKSALEIAVQIASALNEAHQSGIVHRDIKPDNVMIRKNGLAKILDFGIAKLSEQKGNKGEKEKGKTDADDAAPPLARRLPFSPSPYLSTTPGMIIGTANYMSPEQAKGKEIDARSDIFSFGIVFYEMLAGRLPFAGETALEMLGAILKDEPQPLAPEIPSEIQRIVNKCLRKNREERYQTIKEVLIDLSDIKQDLEFQDKLERSIFPHRDEKKTQILQATTVGEIHRTTADQTRRADFKKSYPAIGLLSLLLLFGAILGYKYFAPDKQIRSVAVMPFVNESGDEEIEYLSDGMTDTLIRSLSQLPNLDVKARSSVFRYKGAKLDLKKIGAELGAQAILTGRFVQRGDRLTLDLELVDPPTGNVIWKERYDRRQSDLVSLQSEVARDVSLSLKTKLSGADEQKLTNKGTDNPQAYQAYLKGRYFITRGTNEGQQQSLKYFQEAVNLDPQFALGYAGLADAYSLLGTLFRSSKSAEETTPKARAAAEKAIALDPNLSEAYTSLAWVKFRYDWDWAGAERDFKRAIELNPNNAQAHQWYGEFLSCMNRNDEAVAALKKAVELEPFSVIITWNLGKVYFTSRRFDEAIIEVKKALELDRNLMRGYGILFAAYQMKGMEAEAFDAFLKGQEIIKTPPGQIELYKRIFKEKGMKAVQAKELEFTIREESFNITPYIKMRYYAALGDKEKSLEFLEESYRTRTSAMVGLQTEVYLDFIKDEPRYKEILRKMNFPQ
jgi:eukaryotic-like serine/threonine-protein kinase